MIAYRYNIAERYRRRRAANADMLAAIREVMERHGISATEFGRRALNDPCLVLDMRQGRKLRPSTAERIRAAIEKMEAE